MAKSLYADIALIMAQHSFKVQDGHLGLLALTWQMLKSVPYRKGTSLPCLLKGSLV